MATEYRKAKALDLPRCIEIRGATRDNAFSAEALLEIGVTPQAWAPSVEEGVYIGMVAAKNDEVIGFCFGDTNNGEIMVLAVLEGHEGEGIGRNLINTVSNQLFDAGHQELWLAATANDVVRSYGFYRHIGWQPSGELNDNGDELYRLDKKTFANIKTNI